MCVQIATMRDLMSLITLPIAGLTIDAGKPIGYVKGMVKYLFCAL